jgi:hypothetical protein
MCTQCEINDAAIFLCGVPAMLFSKNTPLGREARGERNVRVLPNAMPFYTTLRWLRAAVGFPRRLPKHADDPHI